MPDLISDTVTRPSSYLYWVPPAPTGHLATFVLRDAVPLSRRPLKTVSNPASPASVVGAPTVEDGYIVLGGGADYLQTAIAESNTMAVGVVGRSSGSNSGTGRAILVGNYAGIGLLGLSLYAHSTTQMAVSVGVEDSSEQNQVRTALLTTPPGTFAAYIMSAEAAAARLENLSTGGVATQAFTAGDTRKLSDNLMRIGEDFSSTFSGTADIAIVTFWSALPSADERQAWHEWCQMMMAAHEIDI